jgi:hypothetical protein
VDFWSLSTTYHNTQAVLTIRCAVASAFVGYCFRDSSPTTRKVDCITVHYTLLPVLLSLFFRLLFARYYYSRATHRLHRGLCGDVPATKFNLFVGARFTQGSRFFTLPHGCLIALLGNSFTWLHYLATYCTISRGAALCATFIHMDTSKTRLYNSIQFTINVGWYADNLIRPSPALNQILCLFVPFSPLLVISLTCITSTANSLQILCKPQTYTIYPYIDLAFTRKLVLQRATGKVVS